MRMTREKYSELLAREEAKPRLPIATALLDAEHGQLLHRHFDDGVSTTCPDCARAYQVKLELQALREISR